MKNQKIALCEIRHHHRTRDLGDVGALANSILKQGLRQPVVMHSDGLTLMSGLRRFHACRQIGMDQVPALIPSDVIEAATALQKEIERADPATDFPMTIRERMDLAHQLHSMPTPSARVAHGIYAAEVVGIPNRSYWRIRSLMNQAKEGKENPSFSMIRARKIADMMLSAVENTPAGWAPTRIIEELHKLRDSGSIPESLESMEVPRKSNDTEGERSGQLPQIPLRADCIAQSAPPRVPQFSLPAPSRRIPEVHRVVASLSGVCAGISSISEITSSSAEDLAYWNSELRHCKKIINVFHALLREASHV